MGLCCGGSKHIVSYTEKGTQNLNVFRFQEELRSEPDLTKYQYVMERPGESNLLGRSKNPVRNAKACIASMTYGGNILNSRNPLKERMREYQPREELYGGYYALQNVQKKQGQPEFFDIWILVESVPNVEVQRRLQDLQTISEYNITHWHKDMLYPYKNKFILWDDIKDSLTGFARVIEFRCFRNGNDKQADPTYEGAFRENWLISITEGEVHKGSKHGFNRVYECINGHCKIGYFKDDLPEGKFVEFDNKGFEWQRAGIYKAGGLAIEEHIPDFNEVAVAKAVKDPTEEDEVLERWREQKEGKPIYGRKKAKDIKKDVEPKDRPAFTYLPKDTPDVKGAKKKIKGSTD